MLASSERNSMMRAAYNRPKNTPQNRLKTPRKHSILIGNRMHSRVSLSIPKRMTCIFLIGNQFNLQRSSIRLRARQVLISSPLSLFTPGFAVPIPRLLLRRFSTRQRASECFALGPTQGMLLPSSLRILLSGRN